MNMHRPTYWVGGLHRKAGWELAFPISKEDIETSIAYAKSEAVARHRENLYNCVEVYDLWWERLSGETL